MWCFKVILSEADYTENRHDYIRSLCNDVIPFIHRHHRSGCYWLWMDLASAYYTNNTLTFPQQLGFIPKLHPQRCKPTMHCLGPTSRRFLAYAQKGFLIGEWEATSLKWRIKKA